VQPRRLVHPGRRSVAGRGTSILDTPVLVHTTIQHVGATWSMTCELEVGAKTDTVTEDITGYVSSAPLGVALVSFGASVSFDSFSLCPN
jgi:hypothetical protein